jgi:hypothetical protein
MGKQTMFSLKVATTADREVAKKLLEKLNDS